VSIAGKLYWAIFPKTSQNGMRELKKMKPLTNSS